MCFSDVRQYTIAAPRIPGKERSDGDTESDDDDAGMSATSVGRHHRCPFIPTCLSLLALTSPAASSRI